MNLVRFLRIRQFIVETVQVPGHRGGSGMSVWAGPEEMGTEVSVSCSLVPFPLCRHGYYFHPLKNKNPKKTDAGPSAQCNQYWEHLTRLRCSLFKGCLASVQPPSLKNRRLWRDVFSGQPSYSPLPGTSMLVEVVTEALWSLAGGWCVRITFKATFSKGTFSCPPESLS